MAKEKSEPEPKENSKTEGQLIQATLDDIVMYALSLPEVEESTSYGQPAVKRNGKLLFALRKDLETLSLASGFEQRDILMSSHPETFFVTDHYLNYPMCIVRLATAKSPLLRKVVKAAWTRLGEATPRIAVKKAPAKAAKAPAKAAKAPGKAAKASSRARSTARRR